jgi:hypothetical protein
LSDSDERLTYRLLTGPDDRSFCEKVSRALADGYVLYGSPAIAMDGDRVICAQAVILADAGFDRIGEVGIRSD